MCFHLLLDRHPQEAAEWLADCGKTLYARQYGMSRWAHTCGRYKILTGSGGFSLGPLRVTGDWLCPALHGAIGCAGTDALLTGLGRTTEEQVRNFRKVADVCRIPDDPGRIRNPDPGLRKRGFELLPTMDEWLADLDRAVPGLEAHLRHHDVLKPVRDEEMLVCCVNHTRQACTFLHYRARPNPAFGRSWLPPGGTPLPNDYDLKPLAAYEELPTEVRICVGNATSPPLKAESQNARSGITHVGNTAVRRSLAGVSVPLPSVSEYWVIVTLPGRRTHRVGPFPL